MDAAACVSCSLVTKIVPCVGAAACLLLFSVVEAIAISFGVAVESAYRST